MLTDIKIIFLSMQIQNGYNVLNSGLITKKYSPTQQICEIQIEIIIEVAAQLKSIQE